ncbi:uncharacterized protein TrAtP1_011478 [Trichoderma atroviride]|uniref:uncharacterized protein n=1 Tax=Hypocrea atroviridis TaxID=63577 RepID=UPI00331B5016|nr:hypothetical protein TrAtP1_011478 [Trichoderma atroviride]
MPSRPHLNSYPPKEKPKKSLTKIDTDVHPTGNVYEQNHGTYKARAHGGPIIKTPRNRALWRRAVYVPHSPHSPPIPTPSSPDISWSQTPTCASPPQIHSPPPPVCLLCMGYLGGEYNYTTCNSCKAKYATPSHRISGEDEYIDDFFSPSPSSQDEDSDAPIVLLDGCAAKGKKPCFINNANDCATLASQSPSLTCSDDEFDGCVTPASCSSSVYSQDESDMDTRRLEHLHGTNRPGSESLFTGSTNSCVTPALSTSSSVYSQDEGGIEKAETERVETERAGTETVGYYELPEMAHYFGEYQQSEGKGFEENVEQDYSLAIDIYYR